MALKDKQKLFVIEYLKDLNATQAAIRAGYSKRTAHSQGPRLLENVGVKAAIEKARESRSERTQVDADYVLKRLAEIDQMDVLDILADDGSLKPIREWPKVWRQFLSGMELTELWEGSGYQRQIVGVLKKIKWPDKVKNLELLGKHVNVQAFREQKEVKVTLQSLIDDLIE
ncbi:terminase small subunit [Microbulbifer sp. 2201CG32-9]|uniref:terminase small subunit n=1 Tax=Microbulbifer sp. 2201CG32-9 TaxID=3232309 RepID=UPI00345BD9DE